MARVSKDKQSDRNISTNLPLPLPPQFPLLPSLPPLPLTPHPFPLLLHFLGFPPSLFTRNPFLIYPSSSFPSLLTSLPTFSLSFFPSSTHLLLQNRPTTRHSSCDRASSGSKAPSLLTGRHAVKSNIQRSWGGVSFTQRCIGGPVGGCLGVRMWGRLMKGVQIRSLSRFVFSVSIFSTDTEKNIKVARSVFDIHVNGA